MNRARRAVQSATDIAVTVLVYLGVVRFRDDQPRPRPARPTSGPTAGSAP